jgi:predicted CoA-substrate-specific enzyme activase
MKQYFVGIDIGSTASKVVVLEENKVADAFVLPTGWNGRETARQIFDILKEKGYADNMRCVATGYGRISVDYADKVITEITCHGKGGFALFGQDGTIVDIGGQDTKVIHIRDGQVADFLMNDKCAAGTGKFIEVMANRLGTDLGEFYAMAEAGTPVSISAMCTVFAESEVIGHIGAGQPREDIAAGVIDSVAARVCNLMTRFGIQGELYLTGGLCDSPYFLKVLSEKTGRSITTHPMARYAGALGAALVAAKEKNIDWSRSKL